MFLIKEGYQGMVDGGQNIIEATWVSASSIIHIGGTVIGTARCMEFQERSGRLKAAENLIKQGITNLVIIGGDGSLTGANIFKREWTSLLDELFRTLKITHEQRSKNKILHIAGMVGSIDNDFCGTDMTIGTDSALHRIIEAIDAIVSTAYSHQRTFIMEVMGRHCGYLALASGLACEADYIFIPEDPAPLNWKEEVCDRLAAEKLSGNRLSIIILAEGAIDCELNNITPEMVKKVVVDNLNRDTRITVLGHVQRGGTPSAFDQILACRLGAEAVLNLLQATDDSEPCVIVQDGNRISSIPLTESVERTQAVAKAMKEKKFELAVELRGRSFKRNLSIYKLLREAKAPLPGAEAGYKLAIMHIGAPACGMNAAVHSFVRNSIYHGHIVYGIYDGIDGLIQGKFKKFTWKDVNGWVGQGSAILRTTRTIAEGKFKEIAERLKEYQIQGLVVVGGFEAYHSIGQLNDARDKYPEFKIPMLIIPASISNNVPGTEFCLGADTSINEITSVCHQLRLAGQGVKRVFVVEVMGGFCGYLATLSALAGGADAAYIFEEKFTIKDLISDFNNMVCKMKDGVQRGLILRNEKASVNYNTDFINRLYSEEGKEYFSTRSNVLGHWQQGGSPSPFDRIMGTKMGSKAVSWLIDQIDKCKQLDGTISPAPLDSTCLLGLQKKYYNFIPIKTLIPDSNFEFRIPLDQWWVNLRPLLKILAMHESAYEKEGPIANTLELFLSKPH
ncbi:unnamed protein product [Diamesa serratosioi]